MRVATDIGGTFTDLVAVDDQGKTILTKSHTTPPNFEEGVIKVIQKSGVCPQEIKDFIHGTTTIINALTERKGAKTALITTKGFRDVLEIARCNRPDLFNMVFAKPRPFIPRYLRKEVEERVSFDGKVVTPLNEEDIKAAVEYFKKEKVEAIAVCYINSYANDEHEKRTVELIRKLWPEVFVTSSIEVTKEWREYERTSTIALNSYVMPVASSYIDNLDRRLKEAGCHAKEYIMQSNGGTTTFEQAKQTPINMVESGPVAGVYGSAILGKMIGERNIIAFDVGGTTAKCSLIDNGEVKVTTEYRIERTESYAGYPIMAPVVDIVEIGNGGGSIAWIDEAGSLKVGPQSAGAVPGPVAYGIGGTEPTTTDACLVTGRLSAENFDNQVDMDAVRAAIQEKVGDAFGMDTDEAAMSILRVAEANMYNALKLISVRRGYDPRDFTMVAFGGGGPMHCAYLAKELNIRKVIVPIAAPVFSAWGMLMTDVRHDYIQTNIRRMNEVSAEELNDMWEGLLSQAQEQFEKEDIPKENIVCNYIADMRYMGQEHTVKVNVPPIPWSEETKEEIIQRFHDTHEHFYTFRLTDTPTEIVNLHLVAYGRLTKPELAKIPPQEGPVEDAKKEIRKVYFAEDGWMDTPVYLREKLGRGAVLDGPVIVEEAAASAVAAKGQRITVDDYGNLIIETEVQE
ncbi:MAG: hydantoinase/oxoprolinase family protein [Merdimonas faecis]|uniref:hydantoinase/oxoprolinase family protein n=1 Tax=Merdimonas faecis TaxID=1653435 RepID=UPI0022E249A5|nr:hydantoinase/oxoprolinase family protein [Merdimonas faecis]MBS5431178.1 hydantoinase/oxoprolinase family protein [Lachnospiraceae bacterium]